MRVLLAEDDISLGQGICDGLQGLGFYVDWLEDGLSIEQAVITDDTIDILILDLGLPKKNGLEVLKSIRTIGNKIPILILTAIWTKMRWRYCSVIRVQWPQNWIL